MKPEVNKYYLSIPRKFRENLKSWDKQKVFYEKSLETVDNLDQFKWSIFLKENNECIGQLTCQEIENKEKDVRDVGWFIDPTYQGKGYCTEAARAMLDFMFKECEIKKIETSAAIKNDKSWKVMEKLGFKRENKTKFTEYTFLDEKTECYCYSITREEYLE